MSRPVKEDRWRVERREGWATVLVQRAWHFSKLRERRANYPLLAILFLAQAINNIPGALRGDVVSIVAVVLSVAAAVFFIATRPRKRGVALGVSYEFTRDGVEMKAIRTDPEAVRTAAEGRACTHQWQNVGNSRTRYCARCGTEWTEAGQ